MHNLVSHEKKISFEGLQIEKVCEAPEPNLIKLLVAYLYQAIRARHLKSA